MKKSLHTLLTIGFLSSGAVVLAEGHISQEQLTSATKARQSHMQLYSFNLGIIGAMAKEEAPYDAATAGTAAASLATLAALPQSNYWLPGSDSDSIEGSRAKPEIWAAGSTVGEQSKALLEAALAMEQAASVDLDALKAAMGPLGSACGDCHKANRVPRN